MAIKTARLGRQTQPRISVPDHVGIILDGNRRWARSHNRPLQAGHEQGLRQIRPVVDSAFESGVSFLSLFVFSTENWRRPKVEVNYLMRLFRTVFKKEGLKLHESNYRIRFAGERDAKLDRSILAIIRDIETRSANNSGPTLIFCFNYGGQTEIISAVKRLLEQGVRPDQVNGEMFVNNLHLPDVPDLDLVIRTSGEQRLSGFQLWRAAYAEIMFVDKYWPDFAGADMKMALAEYGRRQRRLGG